MWAIPAERRGPHMGGSPSRDDWGQHWPRAVDFVDKNTVGSGLTSACPFPPPAGEDTGAATIAGHSPGDLGRSFKSDPPTGVFSPTAPQKLK